MANRAFILHCKLSHHPLTRLIQENNGNDTLLLTDGGCAAGVGAAGDRASDNGHCVETLFPARSGSVPVGAERGAAAVDDGRPGGGAGGTGNPGTGPAGEAGGDCAGNCGGVNGEDVVGGPCAVAGAAHATSANTSASVTLDPTSGSLGPIIKTRHEFHE